MRVRPARVDFFIHEREPNEIQIGKWIFRMAAEPLRAERAPMAASL